MPLKEAIPRRAGTRVTVDLSPDLNDVLEQIAAETHSSKSEIFRKALALIEVAHRATADGEHVGVVRDPKKLDKEIVGLR